MWVGDLSRNSVLIDGNMSHWKALRLYEDFNKGLPEMSDHIYITFIIVLYIVVIILYY